MDDITTQLTIVLLAALAYALVTATLATLAARVRQQRHRHDLIVTARKRRAQYLESIAHRQNGGHQATDAEAA